MNLSGTWDGTWELSGRGAQAGVHEMCRYLRCPGTGALKIKVTQVKSEAGMAAMAEEKCIEGEKRRSVRGKTKEADITPWGMWEQVRLPDRRLAPLVNLPCCHLYHCWAVDVLQIHLVTAHIMHVFIIYNLAEFTYCFCMNAVGWWLCWKLLWWGF